MEASCHDLYDTKLTIFKNKDRYLHFIHIPKTSGTSVCNLLEQAGWKKLKFVQVPAQVVDICKKTDAYKHQHREIWKQWDISVDYRFAFVRNPYERFVSQCKQIAIAEGYDSISPAYVLEKFKVYLDLIKTNGLHQDDNHIRPQHEFIDENTAIFRMEDQREAFLLWCRERDIISKDISFNHLNNSLKNEPLTIVHWPLVPDLHAMFLGLYGEDFEKFGYNKEVPTYGLKINWKKYAKA